MDGLNVRLLRWTCVFIILGVLGLLLDVVMFLLIAAIGTSAPVF